MLYMDFIYVLGTAGSVNPNSSGSSIPIAPTITVPQGIQQPLPQSFNLVILVVILVILVIGFIFYRRHLKSKYE